MDTGKIRDMANDPGLIPGIYNYCDRWCERCAFTDKCLNYKMEQESRREKESHRDADDRSTSELWTDLKRTLDDTIELLRELMRERGLDPDKVEPDEEYLVSEEKVREKTRVHPLTRMSLAYITLTEEYFNSHERIFNEMGMYEEKLPEDAGEKEKRLHEAGEVIRWYLYQINVKIQRALHGKQHGEINPEHALPSDVDGSAKVALIGIDNSLQAWHTLLELFPGESETIADIMIQLGSLRTMTEKEFPGARSFRRPGFDDPAYAGKQEMSHEKNKE